MSSLTLPITVDQLLKLARQLSEKDRRALADALLGERFEATLASCDRERTGHAAVTDGEIQAEVDAVRTRRQERRHAVGG